MDFDKLKTFYHVATLCSITKASDILQMDKSSISRQLALLEEQVKNKLFERKKNHLYLTPQGKFLLEKARLILTEIESTKAMMIAKGDQLTGTLAITSSYEMTNTWLTHVLPPFIEQHPLVQVSIKASNQLLDLTMREADVALQPYCNDQSDLVQKYLMTSRFYLYASKEYLKKFGTPNKPEDLDNHRLIIFGEGATSYPHNSANWPLHIATKNGKIRKPFLVINSVEGMFHLMENGVGIASIAENSPLLKHTDAEVVPLLVNQACQEIDTHFIYHKQFEGIKLIESLHDFLKKHANEQEKLQRSSDIFHIGAKALILNKKGKLLLLLRHHSNGHIYWDIPGGRLERGESMTDTLIRKVKEETGFDIKEIRPFTMVLSELRIPFKEVHDAGLVFSTYLCRTDSITPILKNEFVDFGWFTTHEAVKKLQIGYPEELTKKLISLNKKINVTAQIPFLRRDI